MSARSRNWRVLSGIVLVVVAVGLIGLQLHMRILRDDPKRLLGAALQASLSNQGVVCEIDETSAGSTSKQTIYLDLAGQGKARQTNAVSQHGLQVATEEIGVPGHSYVRYTALKPAASNASIQDTDLSGVLNVWAERNLPAGTTGSYARTALGGCGVPLANLTTQQAKNMASELQNSKILTVDYAASRMQNVAAKRLRAYAVQVHSEPYVAFMKQVGQAADIPDLNGLKLDSFAGKPAAKLTLYVDPVTRHITRITYPGRQRTVTLRSFDTLPNITVPKGAISIRDLQKRFNGQP